jgi:hypothetical protein
MEAGVPGMQLDQARRLKELEKENGKLKKEERSMEIIFIFIK